MAVKVFRASGNLASYLRRVYNITSCTSDGAAKSSSHQDDSSRDLKNVSGPPPLHEVLRTYICDHHHHRHHTPDTDEEEEEGEEEDEEDDDGEFIGYYDNDNDDDDDASLRGDHDANEPGVYAARELLGMFLVSLLSHRNCPMPK